MAASTKIGTAPHIDGGLGNDILNGVDNLINIIYGGAGDDIITGGSQNDVLVGDAGKDTLYGGAGDDSLWGGGNDDRLYGGTGNDKLFGDGSNDRLEGGAGDDVLDGGQGADSLLGGTGNDTYIVANAGDTVVENASEGIDTVLASISFGLSANVENLTLTGTASINGTGNELNNVITGNSGDNVLDGGAGADTLTGGAGNDTYVIDNLGDVVVENAGEGTDTIIASLSHTLEANVENLTLTGTGSINATGNALNNVLSGNAGDNVLDGGAGIDTLIGGFGNDTYIVDTATDLIVEASGQGTDTVLASVSYALSANVENLTLIGVASINATGNELNNVLTGNSGSNILDGGAGSDTMAGGLGNDTYVIDNAGDVAVEAAGQGTDTVFASVSHTLEANIENLTLTGAASINATGNSLDNVITGNSGDNVLDGGTGIDTLAGGGGNDTYMINSATALVVEAAGQGIDTAIISVNYTLADNLENATMAGSSAINAAGNALDNVLTGNDAANALNGNDGNDTLIGGGGNDALNGGAGQDTIYGGTGNDGVFGGGGNDTIFGGAGDDKIYGDGGNDMISGGAGNDVLAGGQFKDGFSLGNDTFFWQRADVIDSAGIKQGFDHIVDFAVGDKLNFSGLGLAAGALANAVHVTDTAAGTVVSANFGGSAGFVDVVVLDGVHNTTLASMINDGSILV